MVARMKPLLLFLLLSLAASARAGDAVADAWTRINAGALVVDVRTAGEFAGGHLDGALNIPYEETGRIAAAISTNRAAPVVVYCRTGRRSGIAQRALGALGYTNVVNGGGLQDLLRARPAARE